MALKVGKATVSGRLLLVHGSLGLTVFKQDENKRNTILRSSDEIAANYCSEGYTSRTNDLEITSQKSTTLLAYFKEITFS